MATIAPVAPNRRQRACRRAIGPRASVPSRARPAIPGRRRAAGGAGAAMAAAARARDPAKAGRPYRLRVVKVPRRSRAMANAAANAVPATRAERAIVAVPRTGVKRARAVSFGRAAKAGKVANPVRAMSHGRARRRAKVAGPAAQGAAVGRRPSRSSRFRFTPSSW